ncbi:unnamed protein product [Mesocestoides corti]|uniref:Histone-lysine N-methyltransferase n=1 Tax=Mesocestoides corti TaxID=53468 RepID=A0A0R3U8G5_MESCO|nr:unnamed protein product [Mesocestoides corti]
MLDDVRNVDLCHTGPVGRQGLSPVFVNSNVDGFLKCDFPALQTNCPIGSVRVYRYTDLSEAPQCDCKASDPCGPNSGCINRALLYECVPSVCVHRDACRNQCFTRREYPPQRPFWTGEARGWGLKTLVPIHKGDFVNEYIGDLIDEEEANRRLRFAHENNITNYYMMQMDSQRIIDAGPKGNLSRFMNHSCCPNLNTQKWTVNGDTRVGLFAVRDIAAGEELTFNYNFCAHGQEMLNCCCGAETCVGYLGARHESASTAPGSSTDLAAAGRTPAGDEDSTRKTSTAPHRNGGTVDCGPSETDHGAIDKYEKVCYSSTRSLVSSVRSASCRCGQDVWNGQAPPTTGASHASMSTNSSSTVSCRGRGRKRATTRRDDDGGEETDKQSVCSTRSSSTTVGGYVEPLVLCTKDDCSKAYHLQCLDLDKRPTGRWFCPWHHCDACGRPATVFCMQCPTSFCPAHVEGSVAVLPPLKDEAPAQVVCLSHTDLIAERSTQRDSSSDGGDDGDDDDDDSEEDRSNTGETDSQRSVGESDTDGRSSFTATPSQGQHSRRGRRRSGNTHSLFRALADSCKRRDAEINRLRSILSPTETTQ